MKYFYAINGSPRKSWNTAQLLDEVLAGMRSAYPDEEVVCERIDLYELNYTGCRSCFACKLKNGASYGKCAVKDDLQPVLQKVLGSDGVVIGSPIYYRTITGQLHSFYERMLFPYTVYSSNREGIPTKHIPFGFIYTMNVTEEEFLRDHYEQYLKIWEVFSGCFLGYSVGHHYAFNTYQFTDYGRYVSDMFSEEDKALNKKNNWKNEMKAAYDLGRKIVSRY